MENLVIGVIFLLVFCFFWIRKFVELMLLEGTHFSSGFDKIIWAAVFIAVFPLAPFAFALWKSARTTEHASVLPVQ